MKRSIIFKIISLALICSFILVFPACKKVDYSNPTKISFKEALDYEYLKTLDGTPVTINGYMADAETPLDGSYIYLMNLPYQNCPFCLPNTNELSNTMAVYAASGKKLEFTTQAIRVTGILEVSSSKNDYFTDFYGYEFNFKIVDAYYDVIDGSEFGESSLFNELAKSGFMEDLNKMYEYLHFTTYWYEYTMEFQEGKDYLYDTDAYQFITSEGSQFNYGYKDGYFDSLRASVYSISETGLEGVIALIDEAEALSDDAVLALKSGLNNQTVFKPVLKYSEEFKDERYQFEYISPELQNRYNTAYNNFMSTFEY